MLPLQRKIADISEEFAVLSSGCGKLRDVVLLKINALMWHDVVICLSMAPEAYLEDMRVDTLRNSAEAKCDSTPLRPEARALRCYSSPSCELSLDIWPDSRADRVAADADMQAMPEAGSPKASTWPYAVTRL
jgi:hypothetical protein